MCLSSSTVHIGQNLPCHTYIIIYYNVYHKPCYQFQYLLKAKLIESKTDCQEISHRSAHPCKPIHQTHHDFTQFSDNPLRTSRLSRELLVLTNGPCHRIDCRFWYPIVILPKLRTFPGGFCSASSLRQLLTGMANIADGAVPQEGAGCA